MTSSISNNTTFNTHTNIHLSLIQLIIINSHHIHSFLSTNPLQIPLKTLTSNTQSPTKHPYIHKPSNPNNFPFLNPLYHLHSYSPTLQHFYIPHILTNPNLLLTTHPPHTTTTPHTTNPQHKPTLTTIQYTTISLNPTHHSHTYYILTCPTLSLSLPHLTPTTQHI
jgi:hypothetical protein